jgi:hypothetical protein
MLAFLASLYRRPRKILALGGAASLLWLGGCTHPKPTPPRAARPMPVPAEPAPPKPAPAKPSPIGEATRPMAGTSIMNPSSEPFPPGTQDSVAYYTALVDRVKPASWRPFSSFRQFLDAERVEHDSRQWAERLFRPNTSPYRVTPVQRTVHHATDDTFDLLRHAYRVKVKDRVLGLEVLESVEFVLVRVAPEGGLVSGGEAALASDIADIANSVLRMEGSAVGPMGEDEPYVWSFQYERPLGEGSRFSTAPAAEPLMLRTFAGRLDGGIRGGVPFFLAYKIHPRSGGRLIALNGFHWFDGKCWEPYQ